MPKYSGLHRAAALSLLLVSAATFTLAVDTHVWQQDDLNEFARGTIKNLSIRSDGRLTLAPLFHEIADLATPYLWTVVADSRGTLYCAGGAPTGATAKVFAVSPQGKSSTVAELTGLEVHALAIDGQNRVYAATSPDSKVYRIGKGGKAEVFFDTKAKYVWAMAFDGKGDLYIATGDQGIIYRVTPDGKGSEFFRTEETHARTMIVDSKGDLIVGTEPGGYVLRITPEAKSFVLFQSSKHEITALAERDHTLYAAASGGRTALPSVLSPQPPSTPAPSTPAGSRPTITVQQATASPPTPSLSMLGGATATAGGSDFYRIDQEGFAEKLWTSASDVIYAIGFDPQGKPLLGTGNKGIIYRIDSAILATQLINAPPTQVTAFASGPGGLLYAVTGNVGKVYAVGPELEKSGWLESEVLDVGSFAYWGKAHLLADLRGGKAELSARSGNVSRPQNNWSDWTSVPMSPAGGQIGSPAARFLQYKLTLTAADNQSPTLSAVQIAYLPKNIAPAVKMIQIEDANYRATATPNFLERSVTSSGSPTSITLPALGSPRRAGTLPPSADTGTLTVQYAKGYVTVRWNAVDENGDMLVYRIEIQGKGENVWRLLKDKVQDKHFSFDGSAFADGEYTIRITASDEPSNTPAQTLKSSFVSDTFTIDNSPPQLTSAGIKTENGQTVIRFSAKDALSWIDKAEYSVNGSEWVLVEPQNRVSDSQQLDYELRVPQQAASVNEVIAVRVFDENDNEAVTRFVVPASK